MMSFDENQAQTFIKLLHGDTDANVCWQVFHDSNNSVDAYKKPTTFHAKLNDSVGFFKAVQLYNYGIYCTLNKTDGNGRALENIRGYSFVFADFDNTVIGDLPLEPHLITQRDETHSHCYWRVKGMVTDEIFKRCQKRAAVYLGTDRQVFDPTRVVRLAGSYNCKDSTNPQMYNIIKIDAEKAAYMLDEFETGFNLTGEKLIDFDQWAENKSALTEGEGYNDDPINRQRFKTWLEFQSEPAVKGNGRSYQVLRVASMARDLGIPLPEAQQMMWEHYNDRIQPPYTAQERIPKLYKYTERAYRYASNAIGCSTAAAKFLRECGEVPEPTGGWEHNKSLKKSVKKSEPAVGNSFSLKQFALNGLSGLMEKQMLEDVFILEDIALAGQLTVIYAAPNVGKTLLTIKMLIESVDAGNINPSDVYYINADDNFNGALGKLKLLEKSGVMVIIPEIDKSNYDGTNKQKNAVFKTSDFLTHIIQMIDNNSARGKVIILDTLKKFTDLMDKRNSTDFGNVLRSFSSNGGSVIALAHVNKQSDNNGKKVHAGTTDIKDDFDCAYILESKEDSNNVKTVCFRNDKSRGNVSKEVFYSYSTEDGINYNDVLKSVIKIEAPKSTSDIKKDDILIEKAKELIHSGTNKKTELIKALHSEFKPEISKRNITQILQKNINIEWNIDIGDRNVHTYSCVA